MPIQLRCCVCMCEKNASLLGSRINVGKMQAHARDRYHSSQAQRAFFSHNFERLLFFRPEDCLAFALQLQNKRLI